MVHNILLSKMLRYRIDLQKGHKVLTYETESYTIEEDFYIFIDKVGIKRRLNKAFVISIEE